VQAKNLTRKELNPKTTIRGQKGTLKGEEQSSGRRGGTRGVQRTPKSPRRVVRKRKKITRLKKCFGKTKSPRPYIRDGGN